MRGDAWSLQDRERLAQLAGRYEVAEIARRLSEESGIPRTEAAVKDKLSRYGLSR